jgi:aminopeptidase N
VPGASIGAAGFSAPGVGVERAGRAAVLVGRSPSDPTGALGFVGADVLDAIPGLARKLPHYGRYSALVFEGAEPTNRVKLTLEPAGSPLVRNLTDGPLPPTKLPAAAPLAELPSRFDRAAILATATDLSDPALEGRGLGSPGLDAATAQVRAALQGAGLTPEGAPFRWTGGDPARELELRNLVVRLPGTDPSAAPVVVTAHLDHLGTGWPDARDGNAGKVHPGADDNASGVAVALELARVLAAEPARLRPVVIAFTTGEEAGLVGARHLFGEELGATPFACVNLDTVGRRGQAPVTVIGADSAREWRFAFQGIGYTTGIQTVFAPESLASSDHAACQAAGAPAVQLFTGPNADYHRPTDTADRLDGEGMVDVADLAYEAVGWLAERAEPLTVQLAGAPPPAPGAGRKVSLGTMPDFGFAGPGVRVQDVMPDSAAARAGVRVGDVIVGLGDAGVADLRALSAALAARAPGDRVAVKLVRDGQPVTVQATLTSR